MAVVPPAERNWWLVRIGGHEKLWLVLVGVVAVGLFLMMPLWHAFGEQNSPTDTYRVNPQAYSKKVDQIAATYLKVEEGVKPPGSEVYLVGRRYSWYPSPVVLDAGKRYVFHVSAGDVQHGFSLHKAGQSRRKVNFQAVPGYEYILTFQFDEPGTYNIICQEYCGIGHEAMVGKIIVRGGR